LTEPSQIDAQIAYLENKLESVGIDPNPEPAVEEKPTLFEKAREKELDKKLGQIHDKAEGRTEAALAQKDVPSAKADSFDDAFSRTYDFLNAPEAEKVVQRDASKLIEQVKANAKRFGVEISDADAMKAALDIEARQAAEAASEHAPVVDHMRAAFRDSSPLESAQFFSQVKQAMDRDPVNTIAWLAQQYGISPQALGHHLARAPQQHYQSQQSLAQAEALVDQTAAQLENFDKYEDDVLELLEAGKIQKTGDVARDLRTAYAEAVKRDGKLSSDDRLEKSLSRAYDRANRRG
jgi:hypothetical protein